jgi:site-specific DNA-methyltransferase (adenine-specific)
MPEAGRDAELIYAANRIRIYNGRWQDVPWRDHVGVGHHQGLVIVTDPPYGTGGWRRNATGQGSDPKATLTKEKWDDGNLDWFLDFHNNTNVDIYPAAVLTFWSAAHTWELLDQSRKVGLFKHRTLYYRKLDPKPGMSSRTRWSIEPIWVLSPDGFQLYGDTEDIITSSAPRAGRDAGASGHPYEKPLKVMLWLLAKVADEVKSEDLVVVDPFGGTGTTAHACLLLGLPCVTAEADEAWAHHTRRRIETAALQRQLGGNEEQERYERQNIPGL